MLIFCYLLPHFSRLFSVQSIWRGYQILLNFIEVIGADRKIVYCVWMVDEDVLFNETWIDENWKQRGKKRKRKRETNEFISHMRSAWSYIVQFDEKKSHFFAQKKVSKEFFCANRAKRAALQLLSKIYRWGFIFFRRGGWGYW